LNNQSRVLSFFFEQGVIPSWIPKNGLSKQWILNRNSLRDSWNLTFSPFTRWTINYSIYMSWVFFYVELSSIIICKSKSIIV
jgi:hypothetical protein